MSGPPAAPDIHRRLQFNRLQLVGMPLIMLVPILALLGQLGGGRVQRTDRDNGVLVAVEFPERDHYESSNRIRVLVENVADVPLTGASVEIDRALLDQFSEVAFGPSLDDIDHRAYAVLLGDLPPGALRVVTIDYRAAARGRLRGAARVYADGWLRVGVEIEMLVFP